MEPINSYEGGKTPYDLKEKVDSDVRKGSVQADILAGEMYDERYGGTQRGLKSRHAQMIALGGSFFHKHILSSLILIMLKQAQLVPVSSLAQVRHSLVVVQPSFSDPISSWPSWSGVSSLLLQK